MGIRMEGYAVGEEECHINSIFCVMEENVVLPKVIATQRYMGDCVWRGVV